MNNSSAAVAYKLLRVNLIFTLPSKRVDLIGWVDDVKLDQAANSDASTNELNGVSVWVECRGPGWSRKVRVATSTADVVRVFQLEVTVRQQTASLHTNHWTFTSWLQVWNTDESKQYDNCSVLAFIGPSYVSIKCVHVYNSTS